MASSNDGKPLIAIAEDHPDLRTLYALWLAPEFATARFSGGFELLWSIAHLEPALLILDVSMPRLDGLQLARTIRAYDRFAAVPVLFVTGHRLDKDAARALEAAGAGYLKKPFDREQLLTQARSLAAPFRPGGARAETGDWRMSALGSPFLPDAEEGLAGPPPSASPPSARNVQKLHGGHRPQRRNCHSLPGASRSVA